MCNAENHSAGCDCGFGPPYTDVMYYGDAREWADEVVDEPWLLRQGLAELDYDQAAIQLFVRKYEELKHGANDRKAVVDGIMEFLGRREVVEEEVWIDTIEVPLYRFPAPRIRGAAVIYSEGEVAARESGWKVKVFGMGTGHSRELEVARNHTFTAAAGACKQVYVPVKFRVARVTTRENGRVVSEGVRGEVPAPKNKYELSLHGRGCKTLPRRLCREQPTLPGHDTVEFFGSVDPVGTVYTTDRSWSVNVAHEASLHLKKILELGPFVRVRRTRKLQLSFALPSGFDYRGHLCTGRLWWELPRT